MVSIVETFRISHSRRIYAAAWTVAAVFFVSNSPTPLFIHLQNRLGFSAGTLTLIFAAYIGGLLVALPLAGQISDRFGRKIVLLPSIAVAIISCLMFASATSVEMLVISRFLLGVSVGIVGSAGVATVLDLAGPKRKKFCSLIGSVAIVLGAALGPLVAGFIAQFWPEPMTMLFAVQLMVLGSALLMMMTLRLDHNWDEQHPWRLHLPILQGDKRRRIGIGIAVFAPAITATAFILSLGPHILSTLLAATSAIVTGITACIMFGVAASVQFIFFGLTIRNLCLASAGATVLSMLCVTFSVFHEAVVPFVLGAVLAGAAQGLGQLGALSLIGRHVQRDHRGEANSILAMGGYVPAGLLPIMAGNLVDAGGTVFGVTVFAMILSLMTIPAAILIMLQFGEE